MSRRFREQARFGATRGQLVPECFAIAHPATFMPGIDTPKQNVVPYHEVPLTNERGHFMMELIDGGNPMNVFRDPAKNEYLEFPRESSYNASSARRSQVGFRYNGTRFSPVLEQIEDLYGKVAEAAERTRS